MFGRICPQCGQEIFHKTEAQRNYNRKKGMLCHSCASQNRNKNNPNAGFKSGEKNIMFGKSVQQIWEEKYGKEIADSKKKSMQQKHSQIWANRDPVLKAKLLQAPHTYFLHDNPAKGKKHKQLYIDKYGEVEGLQKWEEHKQNLIGKTAGSKNGMFGKAPPKGAGSGFGGWYNDWFFRSLLELSFMINYIEKNNFNWVSAETAQYGITYTNAKEEISTYFADFVLNDAILAEIKPKGLRNSLPVLLKEKAAIAWCKTRGLQYIIYTDADFPSLSTEEILKLRNDSKIKFLDKIEEKYMKKYGSPIKKEV